MKRLAVGAIVIWLAFLIAENAALAQAGSTGGIVGKQNKDASGDTDVPAPRKASPKSDQIDLSRRPGPLTMASLRGHWMVKTTCYSGADFLTFDIREASPSTFVGDYGPGGGKIIQGNIDGNQVTLTTQSSFTVTWTASVSNSAGRLNMVGSYSPGAPPGNCRFTARKG